MSLLKRLLPLLALGLFTTVFTTVHAAEAPQEFKVLQFNTWQLQFMGINIGKDRKARLKILPEMLASTGADV